MLIENDMSMRGASQRDWNSGLTDPLTRTFNRATYSDTLNRPAYTISTSWTTRYWGYPH